jgi:hypothetical protein
LLSANFKIHITNIINCIIKTNMIKISTCPKTAPSLLVFESVDFREEAGSTESEISWSLLCGGGFSGIAGWTPSKTSQCARILGA